MLYVSLDEIANLLTVYTQYLSNHGYIDHDWIAEAPSPIHEFMNKKFSKVEGGDEMSSL